MDTAWIALVGTLFGGAGFKIIEHFLSRNQTKVDAATAMREELRKESSALREEMRVVEKDLDEWKEKYFSLLQQYLEMKSQLESSLLPKKEEHEDW